MKCQLCEKGLEATYENVRLYGGCLANLCKICFDHEFEHAVSFLRDLSSRKESYEDQLRNTSQTPKGA